MNRKKWNLNSSKLLFLLTLLSSSHSFSKNLCESYFSITNFHSNCLCHFVINKLSFECTNLNSTSFFRDLTTTTATDIISVKDISSEILISHSQLVSLNLSDLSFLPRLQKLSITSSHLEFINCENDHIHNHSNFPKDLNSLNLSFNSLRGLDSCWLQGLKTNLKHLNVSHNKLSRLESLAFLTSLISLDLSHNLLGTHNNSLVFQQQFPPNLKYLDISENVYSCSWDLAWLYPWSLPLLQSNTLVSFDNTKCRYGNSRYDGSLFLVMEYYSKYINPTCPNNLNCTCTLLSLHEKMVFFTDRVYSVEVNCKNKNLTHFPSLPLHTRTVNLEGNHLNASAFLLLNVMEHHYDKVDNLTLDSNHLDILHEKLLEMRLRLSFSARNNELTNIPFEFAQRLAEVTTVIYLAQNPWRCTCNSQITDLNLISKIVDKHFMTCGPSSDSLLKHQYIENLTPDQLCTNEASGELQELCLQFLCALLFILIIIVFSKLIYDFWVYRTRGQLPWLVLKMP